MADGAVAAEAVFPRGILTRFDRGTQHPRFVASHASGSRISSTDGSEYIDCVMSVGAVILGHGHPAVVEAITAQARMGTAYYSRSRQAVKFAERIIEATPCAEQVRFAPSGSEANMYAVRLASAYTGRKSVLKFEGAYHGALDRLQVSIEPKSPSAYPVGTLSSAGIPDSVLDTTLIAPFNDLETTSRIVREYRDSLAAIIVEPFQRNYPPASGFLAGLKELANENSLLLIFDEVVTGFRFGWQSAQGYYGVTPDLATFGKAVGGGLPVGLVVGPRHLLGSLEQAGTDIWASGTSVGNPLTAAAGLATLDVLSSEGTYDRLFAMGHRVRESLRRALTETHTAGFVTGDGPLFHVYFVDRDVTDHRSSLAANATLHRLFVRECFERGVLLSHTGKSFLSLAHTDADLDQLDIVFDDALVRVADLVR